MSDVSPGAIELHQRKERRDSLGRLVRPNDTLDAHFARMAMEEFLGSGRTQKELARQIGVSSAAVCQWMKDDYRGNQDVLTAKLVAWAKMAEQVTKMKVREAPVWVETPTARQIFDAITFSRAGHTIGLIFGGAGVGKTTAIQHYANSYPNVWVWTASPACSSMMSALRGIRAAIGGYSSGYQRQHIVQDINECLKWKAGVLVVDEAQHLKVDVLDQIRSIYDESGLDLVFSGNEKILARMGGGGRAEFAQITSRIGRRVRIDAPKPEDVAEIMEAWEIMGAKELDYAVKLASLHGGLRLLGNVLREAGLIADGLAAPIDLRAMRMARESLGELA